MRSCIYCGRDLADGEKCQCQSAQNARQAKQNATNTSNSNTQTASQNGGWQQNTYTTGYTKKKKKFNFKKPNFKKIRFKGENFKSTANAVSGFTRQFIKDPVNTASNPGHLSGVQISATLIVTALALSICGYFASVRLLAPLGIAGSVLAGTSSYGILPLLRFALSGTITLTVIELAFVGILYFINRFILRQGTAFKTFIIRPVAGMLPLLVFSILGALISFFTIFGTVMMVLTGFVMSIILTYEALRSEWSFVPSSRAMYLVAVSYFVFFMVIFNIIRIM